MRKKRILMVNESSLLSTGYSTYGYEVLRRLYDSQKYELAELASYGRPEDARISSLPWRYYPVIPRKDDKRMEGIYHSDVFNQWGKYLLNDVCIEFKPDIVFSIRDPYVDEFIVSAASRSYFNYAYMPTVDSVPQSEDYLHMYSNTDGLFAYTDWGLEELRKQLNNPPNLKVSAPSGADLVNYKLLDKSKVRKLVNLPEDNFIIGTVMRNQVRKLYPDLMQAFRLFLDTAPSEIASKSYLYLHTAYPDAGWHLQRLLKEHGIAHRTYFTYYCLNCKEIYPSFFQDGKAPCRLCGSHSAIMPSIQASIPPSVLNEIYALFDVYIQYAVCEGLGMPQIEAAASGTPIMSVDYSAMSDVVRKLAGTPIPVQRMFRDSGTESYRALPDNELFVKQLINFFKTSKNERVNKGVIARKMVEDHYTWEKTTKIWENYFDSVQPLDKWKEPAKIHIPNMNPPSGMSDKEFVSWCFTHIAGRPDLASGYLANRFARDLGLGACLNGLPNMLVNSEHSSQSYASYGDFTRQTLANHLLNWAEAKNQFERKRVKS